MRKILYPIVTIYLLILINSCGGVNNKETKTISLSNSIQDDKDYTIIYMKFNQKYEVNPNDIYIPKKEYTKLKIEYQPLLDKKFISISTGEAILKRKKKN